MFGVVPGPAWPLFSSFAVFPILKYSGQLANPLLDHSQYLESFQLGKVATLFFLGRSLVL